MSPQSNKNTEVAGAVLHQQPVAHKGQFEPNCSCQKLPNKFQNQNLSTRCYAKPFKTAVHQSTHVLYKTAGAATITKHLGLHKNHCFEGALLGLLSLLIAHYHECSAFAFCSMLLLQAFCNALVLITVLLLLLFWRLCGLQKRKHIGMQIIKHCFEHVAVHFHNQT